MLYSLLMRLPRWFTGIGLGIVLMAWVFKRMGNKLPGFLQYSFLYGKLNTHRFPNLEVIRVPKSWFTSFYIVGTLMTSGMLFLEVTNPNPHPTVLCALGLFLVHVARRLYESSCVSVYGPGQMSLTHLIIGLLFYVVTPTTLYAARTFASLRSPLVLGLFTLEICAMQYSQHLSIKQLAQLRNQAAKPTGSDKSVANQYFEPRGSMFTYITCPHFLFEMAIYLSLHLLLSISWMPFSHMVVFVLLNQSSSACLNYNWYREHFPEWAASRYVLIPYVW